MSWAKSFVAASLVVALPAFAGIESIEVRGEGPNRTYAIQTALVSAVQQVVGVSISAKNVDIDQFTQSNEGFAFNKQNARKVSFGTAGNATYRILSDDCAEGGCTVRLLANVEYDDDVARQKQLKGMNGNRRTLAIEPFSANGHAKTFTQELEAWFVQDRLFSVVADRSKPGVDYVLRGTVLEAKTEQRVKDTRRTLELTGEAVGEVTISYSSKFIVEYQLIDVINNQIKWSAKVPTTSGRNNLDYLIKLSARKVFDALKDNIYPAVLFATDDGNLVLNSGGKTVQEGEYYDVFAVGVEMIDPYTKESLGYTENKVGQVRVTKVQHKVAYVELTHGNRADMQDLPYARRAQPPTSTKSASLKAKSAEEQTPPKLPDIVF